jgi:hypothetical protein
MKPARPKNFTRDDKSLCAYCNTYNVGVHKPYCDFAPEPQPEPVNASEVFEDGVLWALTLLKKHVNARTDALDAATRLPNMDDDVGHVLYGTAHVLRGFLIRFETDTMKQLNARRLMRKDTV